MTCFSITQISNVFLEGAIYFRTINLMTLHLHRKISLTISGINFISVILKLIQGKYYQNNVYFIEHTKGNYLQIQLTNQPLLILTRTYNVCHN